VEWPFEIAERYHEILNPTSPEKIVLLGKHLGLTGESRVLDVACGKAGPAVVLARRYGCRITGIEIRPAFAEAARAHVAEAGLDASIEIRTGDAAELELEPESVDAALCIGAAFVWGTIADAAAALGPAVRPGGFVAIGEPFWRRWPPPGGVEPREFVSLAGTAARLEEAGFALTAIVAASEDDWDRYESLHWRAIEEWLAEEPDHPDANEIRSRHDAFRRDYLAYQRALLGWAIFVGRKI
jgi:SAM-dependent methyltransferase